MRIQTPRRVRKASRGIPATSKLIRQTVTIREWTPAILTLSGDDVRALARLPGEQIQLTPVLGGQWRVVATNHAGILALPHCDLFIRPKIDSSQVLAKLLGFAFELLDIRAESSFLTAEETLPEELLIAAFLDNVSKLLANGLRYGYVETEDEARSSVRGRINVVNQLRRNPFRPDRLFCVFDEFTQDIPDNQLLLAALEMINHSPLRSIDRSKLRGVMSGFVDVRSIHRESALSLAPVYTRLNAGYEKAHRLASLILANGSPGFAAGSFESKSFLINMFQLWERFVAGWLRERSKDEKGLKVGIQRPVAYAHYQTGTPEVGGQLDLVMSRPSMPPLIIDSKYKDPSASGIDSRDVSQLITYSLCTKATRAVLVYPSISTRKDLRYEIVNSNIVVEVAFIPVGEGPGVLDLAMEELFLKLVV